MVHHWLDGRRGCVALASGVTAGSIAFGLDSLIELASACVLIWRPI
jgi:hypothetical protein